MYSPIQVFKMKLVVNEIFDKYCTRNDYVSLDKAKCVIELLNLEYFCVQAPFEKSKEKFELVHDKH